MNENGKTVRASLPIEDGSCEALVALAVSGQPLQMLESAQHRMNESRSMIVSQAGAPSRIYGVNTGLGALGSLDADNPSNTQTQYIANYAVGQGQELSKEWVALATILRMNTLCHGYSGVRVQLVEQMLALYNAGYLAVVPSMGSVGASGDLIPLAHIALPLLGRGLVRHRTTSEEVDGGWALKAVGREPLMLEAKEGLALVNGYSVSAAIAAFGVVRSKSLCELADLTGALTTIAIGGHREPFESSFDHAGWGEGASQSAQRLRALLVDATGLGAFEQFGPHDPYSIRCIPQVHGAVRNVVRDTAAAIEQACGSVSDNPIIFPYVGPKSGGMFHGAEIALRMDGAAIALASLAGISDRRIALLLDDSHNGKRFPRGLAEPNQGTSPFIPLQILGGSYLASARHLAAPVSTGTAPWEAGLQDFVSLSLHAAIKAIRSTEALAYILAIELVIAVRALELSGGRLSGRLGDAVSSLCDGAPDNLRLRVSCLAQRFLSPNVLSSLKLGA